MTPERCPNCGGLPVLLPDWSGATCRECPLPVSLWPAVQALKDENERLKAELAAVKNENVRHKAAIEQLKQELWASRRVEA